jgi:hypothetical protein
VKFQVSELKGYKSLRAFNAFHALMLGLKMIPQYMSESYEDFLARVQAMPFEDQQKMIRQAAHHVELQREEVEALVSFTKDSNGVPNSAENLNSYTPTEIVEIIVAVCSEISRIKIDFVSENEKKN